MDGGSVRRRNEQCRQCRDKQRAPKRSSETRGHDGKEYASQEIVDSQSQQLSVMLIADSFVVCSRESIVSSDGRSVRDSAKVSFSAGGHGK